MPRVPSPALPLLYCDADLVAVSKPPGLASVADGATEPCVVGLLRKRPELRDRSIVRVVHRLDRDASGVQLCARTLAAQRGLVAAFSARVVEQVYHAIVVGRPPDDGVIDVPLAFDRRRGKVIASAARGRPARTRFRVLQRLAGHALLECHAETDRQHQLRVHLATLGHPLAVDPLYGGGEALWLSHFKAGYSPSRKGEERPLIARLTLHALRLTVPHPNTGVTLMLEAPPPKDFRAAVNQLGRLADGR